MGLTWQVSLLKESLEVKVSFAGFEKASQGEF